MNFLKKSAKLKNDPKTTDLMADCEHELFLLNDKSSEYPTTSSNRDNFWKQDQTLDDRQTEPSNPNPNDSDNVLLQIISINY